MQPVAQEIGRQQHQHGLRPDRPGLGPQSVENQPGGVQRLDERQHEQHRDAGRQQHLHQRHVGQIAGHRGTVGMPGAAVWQTPFQRGHQRRADHGRHKHCPLQGHPLGPQA